METVNRDNTLTVKNIREVKKSLRRFFLIEKHKIKTKCELCTNILSPEEKKISPMSSYAIKNVLSSLLAPSQIEASHLSCALKICRDCKTSFLKLTELFEELEKLRKEYNSLRLNMGLKVIEGCLRLSAEDWRKEVRQAESIFPSCVRFMKGRKEIGVCTENDLEVSGNLKENSCQEAFKNKVDQNELPKDVEQFWSMEDANLKIEYEERDSENYFSDSENLDSLNAELNLFGSLEETKNEGVAPNIGGSILSKKVCLFVCSVCDKVFSSAGDLQNHTSSAHNERDGTDYTSTNRKTNRQEFAEQDDSVNSGIITDGREKPGNPITPAETITVSERSLRRRKIVNYKKLAHMGNDHTSSNSGNETAEAKESYIISDAEEDGRMGIEKEVRGPEKDPLWLPNDSATPSEDGNCMETDEELISSEKIKCTMNNTEDCHSSRLTNEKVKLKWNCQFCPSIYGDVFSLADHVSHEHELDPNHKRNLRWKQSNTLGLCKCYICGKVFSSSITLHRHRELIHFLPGQNKGKMIPCSYCDMTFSNNAVAQYHEFQNHSFGCFGKQSSQCIFCLKFFSTKQNMETHKANNHLSKNEQQKQNEGDLAPCNISCFVCEEVQTAFSNVDELKDHEGTEEHKQTLKLNVAVYCNVCKLNFNGDKDQLKSHFSSPEHVQEMKSLGEYDPTVFCVPCKTQFGNHQDLITHNLGASHSTVCGFRKSSRSIQLGIKRKEMSGNFPCPKCPLVFHRQRGLKIHVGKMHSNKRFERKIHHEGFKNANNQNEFLAKRRLYNFCKISGKKLASRLALRLHATKVHNARKYVCEECGKEFLSQNTLKFHIRNRHFREQEKQPVIKIGRIVMIHKCPHCSCSWSNVTQLKDHLNELHKEEYVNGPPVFCDVCFKCLKTNAEMKKHQKVHQDLKCPVCQKRSTTKQNLKAHMRVHTGEKPFSCSYCQLSFAYYHERKKHEKTHEDEGMVDV